MAYTRSIPEPWRQALIDANLTHPLTDEPTLTALARRAGLATSTIGDLINGTAKNPRAKTITQIADALGVSTKEVASWFGQDWGVSPGATRELPPEARALNRREWNAVIELIRVLAAAHQQDDDLSAPAERVVTGKKPAVQSRGPKRVTTPRASKAARKTP